MNHHYILKYSTFHNLSQLCTLLAHPAPGLQLSWNVGFGRRGSNKCGDILQLSTGTGRLFSHYGVDGEQQFSAEIVEKVLVLRQITFL